jgi:hypothetical protein
MNDSADRAAFSPLALRAAQRWPRCRPASAVRRNVERQRGWLVLSPRAEQIVASTGHAVEEDDPQLVIDTILGAVDEAR